MKKKIGITAAVILGILAVCYIGFAVFFQSHFCFGTTIDGIKVGGCNTAKVEQLIEEFSLQKVRKSYGIQLSGGERRRCEIARALAINPKFILLDEPFAGVDPIAVEDIQHIIAKLKKKNIGIIITDHNVHETLAITDRAYLQFEGRILYSGTPEELASNPDARKKYLGSNFDLRKAKLSEREDD